MPPKISLLDETGLIERERYFFHNWHKQAQ